MGVLPGAPIYAALVQLQETLCLERRGWGWKSLTRHQFQFAHVVQRRDGALKTRTVSVRVRPWAPTACRPMKRRSAQDGKVAGASPAARTNWPELESGARWFRSGDKLAGGLTTSSTPRTPAPFWNVNRTSEPGLGANECVPAGKWCKSTSFRQSCRRSPSGV